MSLVRVLIVDDFDPWRGFLFEQLRQRPNIRIIDQASDGLEAVQKAEDLQPDLILLDISLPALNGIAAAREIRKRAPKSKILFVSASSDADIVESALSAGGHGYVLKLDAATCLWPGIEAVLLGKQFLSCGLIRS
jgi:two-component system nitrate/nitrite response regulator NarL